ncbi:hypothetical protein ACP70R_036482 [Stipagrostis hirtigluma subsp. patula]
MHVFMKQNPLDIEPMIPRGLQYNILRYRAHSGKLPESQGGGGEAIAMEYGLPYTGRGSSKEKRPPLKRGQLKLQIAKTLSSLVVPAGGKNRERSFGR